MDSRWQGRTAVCRVTAGGKDSPRTFGRRVGTSQGSQTGVSSPLQPPSDAPVRSWSRGCATVPDASTTRPCLEFMGIVAGVRHSAWWWSTALASFAWSGGIISPSPFSHEMVLGSAPLAVSDHASVSTGWSATFPGRGASTNGPQQFVWLGGQGRESDPMHPTLLWPSWPGR